LPFQAAQQLRFQPQQQQIPEQISTPNSWAKLILNIHGTIGKIPQETKRRSSRTKKQEGGDSIKGKEW
jgi:hypothetical protein